MTNYGRRLPKYSEEFRKKVVKEVMESEDSIVSIIKRYRISSASIYRWLDKYGSGYIFSFAEEDQTVPMKKNAKNKKEEKSLTQIEELKEALRIEKLKTEAYEKMIEIAEEAFKISIAKKSGTKQSKR